MLRYFYFISFYISICIYICTFYISVFVCFASVGVSVYMLCITMWGVCPVFYVCVCVLYVYVCMGGLHVVLGFVCCVYNVVHVYVHMWCWCVMCLYRSLYCIFQYLCLYYVALFLYFFRLMTLRLHQWISVFPQRTRPGTASRVMWSITGTFLESSALMHSILRLCYPCNYDLKFTKICR